MLMYGANVHACRKFNDLSEKQPALRPNWLEKKICGSSGSPPHLLGQIYLQASELEPW